MRADARALDLRLQERRDGQAFGRGFDRSLLNAWAGAGYQSYFLRDRSGGHGVSPVGDSGPADTLRPSQEMQGTLFSLFQPARAPLMRILLREYLRPCLRSLSCTLICSLTLGPRGHHTACFPHELTTVRRGCRGHAIALAGA